MTARGIAGALAAVAIAGLALAGCTIDPVTFSQYRGVQPGFSADGRQVFFASLAPLSSEDTNNTADIYVRDRASGRLERLRLSTAVPDGMSSFPSPDGSGQLIAFQSDATNLVAGDTNGASDVFVHDRASARTVRVSLTSAGGEADGGSFGPAMARDGRFVAFTSAATNLVAGDGNAADDVFVRDLITDDTRLVSRTPVGTPGQAASRAPSICATGGVVAFVSAAGDLVAGDANGKADVFVFDVPSGRVQRVSVATSGEPDGDSGLDAGGQNVGCSISADGRFVAFTSAATNLVPGDGNAHVDVFVRDRLRGRTARVSVSAAGVEANDDSGLPAISADGRFVAFPSKATNLVEGDTNGVVDVFRAPNPLSP